MGIAAGALALALALVPSLPASASETWNFVQYNCGSSLLLTSMYQNSAGMHQHYNSSGGPKVKNVSSVSGYTWSYFNSGYTSGTSYITSNGDISNGSRSCDW